MSGNLEVSFNSPQCGWMSIGFGNDTGEFYTTTSCAPHSRALAEIIETVAGMVSPAGENLSRTLKWNRDPEEYDFVFTVTGGSASIEIFEYPTEARDPNTREPVFSHTGDPLQIARAFFETFEQLFEERGTDEFEQNWHQEFPLPEYEKLRQHLSGE